MQYENTYLLKDKNDCLIISIIKTGTIVSYIYITSDIYRAKKEQH